MVYVIFLALLGLVAGWLAGLVMKGHGFGVLANMGLGLVGALLGGLVFRATGIRVLGPFGLLIMATVGSIVVLAVARVLRKPA